MHDNAENITRRVEVTLDEARGYYSPLNVERNGDGFVVTYPVRHYMNEHNSFLKVFIPSTVLIDEHGAKRWPFSTFFNREKTALEDKLAQMLLFDYEREYRAIRGYYGHTEKGEPAFRVDDNGDDVAFIVKGKFHIYCKEFPGEFDILKLAGDRTMLLTPMDNLTLGVAY